MNNPYSQYRLAKLQRASPIRRVWVIVTRFPVFILWQFSRLIPDELGRRMRKRFGFLLAPFQGLIDLLMFWLGTRAWIHLFFATPVILLLASIYSTLFLANSMSEADFYKPYRQAMMTALQVGNNKKADFIAGKLLTVKAYKKDEAFLFGAMMAANEVGNIPRRDMLRNILTTEVKSPRTHLWTATALLADRGRGRGNLPRAIDHIKQAIELSDNPEQIKAMKMQLVNVYYRADRPSSALEVLNELGVTDYRMGVLRGSIYLRNNQKLDARQAALDTLSALSAEDVDKEDYFKVQIDALGILSDAGGNLAFIEKNLIELTSLMEKKIALNPDDEDAKELMAKAYLLLGRTVYQGSKSSEHYKTLVYFDKALSMSNEVPAQMGGLALSVTSMPEPLIRQALIRGDGVASGHMLLGINAWKTGKNNLADVHFRLAYDHEPKSLRVLEMVSLTYTQRAMGNTYVMSLDKGQDWRKAIELLDIIAEIDEVPLGSNLKFKCLVLAERQRWHEIVVLLEKHIDKISGPYRVEFLQILIRAHGELGDLEKAREYNRILQEQPDML